MATKTQKPTKPAVKVSRNGQTVSKPEPKVTESTEFYGNLSIATISKRTDLDRATVKKRLDTHKIEPVHAEQKLKLYHFDEALEALLLEQDTKLTEAKTRRELAMAEEREIKVKILREEVASVQEFTDFLSLFAGGLYKDICVRLPKRIAARLAKAQTAADCEALMFREIDKEFQSARENFAKYFGKSEVKRAA